MKSARELGLVLFLMFLAKQGVAQTGAIYQCLGGCYNKCIIEGGLPLPDKIVCLFFCNMNCFFPDGPGAGYACLLSCSFVMCSKVVLDKPKVDECVIGCHDKICRIKN